MGRAAEGAAEQPKEQQGHGREGDRGFDEGVSRVGGHGIGSNREAVMCEAVERNWGGMARRAAMCSSRWDRGR